MLAEVLDGDTWEVVVEGVGTCARLVVCWRGEDDGVAGFDEAVVEESDVEFGPAIVVGEDNVGALGEEGEKAQGQ